MKTKTRTKEFIYLPNGCHCSTPTVYPKDWKTCTKEALDKNWYIQYYFYDPKFPKPTYPVTVKGMNKFMDLASRRKITKVILLDEIEALTNKGYNPYLKKYTALDEPKPLARLNPELLVIDAFRGAFENIKGTKEHLYQIKNAIDRFEKATIKLRFDTIIIYDFKRSQFKEIIEFMKLPANYFNKFKSYFSTLFKELIEWECCEINITRDIQKKPIVKNQRETLESNTVSLILDHLKINNYPFYRYGKIFFYSGARSTELLSVQFKHVRLEKQEYDILIKKGKQHIWQTKVIIKNAVPFWSELMQLSKSKEDFIFSHGLVPGELKNCAKQITIRWRKHVKDKLVIKNGEVKNKAELDKNKDFYYNRITADFYSMKHTFLDLLDDLNNGDLTNAKAISSHTSENTTKIYTSGRTKRNNEHLKTIKV
jgi:integrase